MSVLVALVREAQPGRPAEVREALRAEAQAATQQHRGIRAYQLLQGRAQSNLYVDIIEWESQRAYQNAQPLLRERDEELRELFLRPAHLRVYRPLEIVRVRRREAEAVGVGLIRVRPGCEEQYAKVMQEWLKTHFRERTGLLAAGLYQGQDEAQQFLVRTAWDSEDNLIAHRMWMTREILPTTDPCVARREVLAMLMRWHYRQTPLAAGEAV
jgi:heme-degrading monooxygenase HmoA